MQLDAAQPKRYEDLFLVIEGSWVGRLLAEVNTMPGSQFLGLAAIESEPTLFEFARLMLSGQGDSRDSSTPTQPLP